MKIKGKGIYVSKAPRNLAERAEWLGLDWVAVQTWSMGDRPMPMENDELRALSKDLAKSGIKLWLWGWPNPKHEDFVQHLASFDLEGVAGYILDVEKAWIGEDLEEVAYDLIADMRGVIGCNRGLGFTSYGFGKRTTRKFPWDEFGRFCDFGMPQVYDARGKPVYPDDFLQRCVDQWADFCCTIVPVLGINSTGSSRMKQYYSNAMKVKPSLDAIGWWSLGGVVKSPSKARMLKSFCL